MGTNYNWYKQKPCECCNRPYEPLHIGKSSTGWCFALHVIPEEEINLLSDWELRFRQEGSEIRDEYGTLIDPDEMMQIITDRKWNGTVARDDGWYSANNARPGPNGLARATYRARAGDGTYDLIDGDFS